MRSAGCADHSSAFRLLFRHHVLEPSPGGDPVQQHFEDIRREGKAIHIQRQGSSKAWNVNLIGIDSVENMEKVEIETVDGSKVIKVDPHTDKFVIQTK